MLERTSDSSSGSIMRIPLSSLLPAVLLTTGSLISLSCASPFVKTKELAGTEQQIRTIEIGPESSAVAAERISKSVADGDISQISTDGRSSRLPELFGRMRRSSDSKPSEKLCKCVDSNIQFKGKGVLLRIIRDIANFLKCAQTTLNDLSELNWPGQGGKSSDGNATSTGPSLAKLLLDDLPSLLLYVLKQSDDMSIVNHEGHNKEPIKKGDNGGGIDYPYMSYQDSGDNGAGNDGIKEKIDPNESSSDELLKYTLSKMLHLLGKLSGANNQQTVLLEEFEKKIENLSSQDIEMIAARTNVTDPRCKLMIQKKIKTIRSLSALSRSIVNWLGAVTGALNDLHSSFNDPGRLCAKLEDDNPTLSLFNVSGLLTGKLRDALQSSSSSGELCLPVDKFTAWISQLVEEFPQLGASVQSLPIPGLLSASSSDCKSRPSIKISYKDSNTCGQSGSKSGQSVNSAASPNVELVINSCDNKSPKNENNPSPATPGSAPLPSKDEGSSAPAPSSSDLNPQPFAGYESDDDDE
ncbi:uncharacterized protein LOC107040501 [Diachasma alloeum]|uniref:uncharacterized protein LOC107040501 n=1 Tax=Diachasma alloeum TaxID=454923 RepID=UPI00073847EC|nr:uncharacterized protein LOC107040501 [Diachasma alloeum]XP_015116108.1 uncharacterized protein LOC107040501 [Diachasma alloeum]